MPTATTSRLGSPARRRTLARRIARARHDSRRIIARLVEGTRPGRG